MPTWRFRSTLVLAVCCVLTAIATRWFVLLSLGSDCDGAIDFYRHKDVLISFVRSNELADGEQVNGERLPEAVRSIGITNVYRNGRFVYFVMPHRSILADDATREFIWQRDRNGGAVEAILKTTNRHTYHIQAFTTAPGWYFWMHN